MKVIENMQGYSLAALAKRHLKKDRSAEKDDPDAWRLRYNELYGVPLADWPKAAKKYALEDAEDTLSIAQIQWDKHRTYMGDSPSQARAAFALQLMMCWGVMTDPGRIEQLREASEGLYWELSALLVKEGLVRGDDAPKKQQGTRNVRAAQKRMLEVRRREGLPLMLTDTGYDLLKKAAADKTGADPEVIFTEEELVKYMSVDEDACNESGDELLQKYSRRTQLHNILNTHIPDLLKGVHTPIQPYYKTMVESGRTSCSKGKDKKKKKKKSPTNGFQFQNPKRALDYFPPGVGIRECFIARHRKLFADPDFTGLELCSGAQACMDTVGYSHLADALNAGRDPHLEFGAKLMGISYEEAKTRKHEKEVKAFRQRAKPANFGLPGGLGAPGLMGLARGYGVKLTREEAKKLIADWFEMWPEWVDYFKYVRSHIDRVSGTGQIKQLRVSRIRGGVTYTSACNTLFQGLGADGAKAALYEVAKRCYVRHEGSVLYGVRPVGFIHDEILAEVDEQLAHEQAVEMAKVMEDACNVYLPDVPVKCEPTLAKRWSKDIEAVYDRDGRLQPWDLAKEGRWEVYYGDGERVVWK
jgi:DNA polymerase-1